MMSLTHLQLLMANGMVPDSDYGPHIIRALLSDPSYVPALRELLSAPSRWVGPSLASTLLEPDSPAAAAFASDSEAGLLLASSFLRDAYAPARGSNRDEPSMLMIECLLFAVPSDLLPAGQSHRSPTTTCSPGSAAGRVGCGRRASISWAWHFCRSPSRCSPADRCALSSSLSWDGFPRSRYVYTAGSVILSVTLSPEHAHLSMDNKTWPIAISTCRS